MPLVRDDNATLKRCRWCQGDALYEAYHDQEWGVPVDSKQALFERLILEGMQAGLAWITILRKRETMREAFFQFDVPRLAKAGGRDLEKWLKNPGVIRHRGKLEAMVGNARLADQDQSFVQFLWSFAPTRHRRHRSANTIPSETAESKAMSNALKQKGYRFVGPTICYAFMQSVGMVNDHPTSCWRHAICADAKRPPHGAKV